ncbi:MAG: hypothetical protein QMB47_07720 [Bacteroidales bacterium]
MLRSLYGRFPAGLSVMSLPESTETRWNLRHSERSERGGKVPEGLRVIQVGDSSTLGKDATAD